MIIDALVTWWQQLATTIAGTLPDGSPFDSAGGASGWAMFNTMDYFLPVHELLSVFVAVFALGGPMAIVTLALWFLFGIVRGGSPRA